MLDRRYISIFIIFFSFIPGCFLLRPPNTFLQEDFEKYHIKRVAVLPFFNNTNVKDAGEILTRAFLEELFDSEKLDVEFQGNVRKFLVRERIIVRKGVTVDNIKLIGKRLNVDAVIIGWVEQYYGGEGKDAKIPVVSVNARMIHTDSCSVVWIGQNKRTGDDYITVLDFGKIRSVAALARRLVSELVETIP